MDNGRSHIETNEGTHPFIMGRSFGALVTTILFCMLAFNLLKKKKKRASTPSFISPTPTGEGNDHYDVFLSFRGSDTRKEFADHLYHSLDKAGIVPVFVFRDDKSIPIGEKFSSRILDAIAQSKISILIISKNYASSKWCLRELIHIMDHAKSTSHIVLPIFYKVDPSDVRYLKGSFGKAFHSRKKYFDEDDIQKGQQALKEVSYLHGWESEKVANGHEGELVKKVIENVLSKLQQDFQLDVTEHLVGIDDHVNKIMKWVDSPTTNARMIGIYGMGGIGKTTLAKVIYNQLSNDFVHRSFLADIRETACRNSIVHLQKQLIKDILQIEPQFGNVDDGISLIKSRFKGKNVLILLDDIDHEDQLNALARECNCFMAGSIIIVTTRYEAILDQSKFDVHKYDLNELDQEHALLLFNRHAFYMDHSSKDFEGLSRDIVSTTGGLPLALKVVGSYLYKKPNQEVWEDMREQLKSQPHRDVQKILQISYDALEDGHKQIFLDIVCFFIGKGSEYAMYMWKDCGLYPSQGIEELKLRCLIKIGDYGHFEMHDQLRDLGRSIFCQEQPPGKRSGPWDDDYEGVPKVLRTYKWTRFVDFLGAASSKDSVELFSEVRWVDWRFEKHPFVNDLSLSMINFRLPNLSILELSSDMIMEDWQGWISFMASKQLKVLQLDACNNLRCTPDLSTFTRLKILRLYKCEKLEHLHPSIGKLTSLVSLTLKYCKILKELPEEIGELKNLEELILYHCGITTIPMYIGFLGQRETPCASCKSLREIPDSIGDLQNLQCLELSYSTIEKLPSEIGDLPSLKILNLRCTLISDLPKSIWNLSSLQHLDLGCCKELRSLPKLPSSLQSLCLSFCEELRSLLELPSSLQSLQLWGCKELQSLPELPSSLHSLYLGDCKELQSLPELPSSLQCLKLKGCNKLRLLLELPSSLIDLSVTCQSLGLRQLFSLTHLKTLEIFQVRHLLEDIHELSTIALKLCFEEWDKLTSLWIRGLTHLEELSIKKCNSIERLTLSQLIHLKRLHIEHCDSLVEIKGYGNLESLEVICLYECKWLKKLEASGCGNLVEIQGLDGAKFLEELDLRGCKSIETLPDLRGFEKLQSLIVQDCKKLTQLRGLEKLNLICLDISGSDSLEPIPNLPGIYVYRNYEEERPFDSDSDIEPCDFDSWRDVS